jgi:hypothetical protein
MRLHTHRKSTSFCSILERHDQAQPILAVGDEKQMKPQSNESFKEPAGDKGLTFLNAFEDQRTRAWDDTCAPSKSPLPSE